MIQVLVQLLARLRLDIQQEMIGTAQDVRVGQNSAFVVQEERVAAGAGRKLLDVIGGHRVQQARAVLASQFDFAAGGEIQPGGAVAQSFVAGHVSEIHRK